MDAVDAIHGSDLELAQPSRSAGLADVDQIEAIRGRLAEPWITHLEADGKHVAVADLYGIEILHRHIFK